MNSEHQNGKVTGNGVLAEQALRASELSYRRLFEAAKDGILILNVDTGRITDVNLFLVELLGYSHGEMVGKTISELSPFKDIVSNQAMLEQLQKDGYVRYEDLPLETRGGRKIAVEFVSNVYQAGEKKVIQCNIRDITEHKRAEAALRKSEERYRGLFEHMVEGFAHCRMIFENGEPRDWIYLSVNHMFEKLTGLKGVAGKRVSEVIPGIAETDPELFKIYARVSLTGNAERFEMFIQALQQWFAISVYSPEKEFFVAVFDIITERKRGEDTLQQMRFCMENAGDGIFWISPEGRLLYVNKSACQRLGYTESELLGMNIFDLDPDFQPGNWGAHWEKLKGLGGMTFETRHRAKDGHMFPVEVNANCVRSGGQELNFAFTRDITERKQAEVALRNSEAFLNTVIEKIPHMIFVKDAKELRFLKFNQAGQDLLGYSLAELAGKSDYDLFPKEMADYFTENDRRVLCGQEVVDIPEEPVQTRKKGERILHTKKIPIFDNAGQLLYLLGISEDITEHKRAEAALKREEALLTDLLDSIPDHIYFKDRQSRFIRINGAMAQHFGLCDVATALGKTDFDMFTEEHARQAYNDEQRIMETGEPIIGFEEKETWPNGRITWVSTTKMPLRGEGGRITGLVGISRDITASKALEEQLRQAQKMEAIGQLASGVAHDFNNILGVIMGYGDLIAGDLEPGSPLRKYAEEIRHAAERAAGLTQQLLVFSRKQKVQAVVLDLNDTVKSMDKMLRRLIGENIEMTVVPGKELGRIKADSGHIGQVLMNLAVNARDAMPNGGKLTITTNNVTLDENYAHTHAGIIPGDHVMLAVSDTGTGMTEEIKARIFEALFTTKPAGKGTGLGLATCQTIVQQSSGHIDVDSEVGKGTTFKIYFPRVEKPLEAATGPGQTGPLPRGTETLLLVEDEPSVRHLAMGVLEAQGYNVLCASNGQDALQVAHKHNGSPICLVVTDVIMPQMGGKVMAEWLKTSYPDIKILFTSGYTDDAIAEHGVLEPGVAFLPKPYTTATLACKVREMLDNETDTSILRKRSATVTHSPGSP